MGFIGEDAIRSNDTANLYSMLKMYIDMNVMRGIRICFRRRKIPVF